MDVGCRVATIFQRERVDLKAKVKKEILFRSPRQVPHEAFPLYYKNLSLPITIM